MGVARLFVAVGLLGLASIAAARADDQPLPLLRSMALLPDEPNYVDLAVGGYALYGHHYDNQDIGGSAELRLGQKWEYLGPAVGVVGNVDGGVFVYAGAYTDIQWGSFVITPLFGVGADRHGDSHDEYLGGVFEFRLQVAATYQFDNASRLGVQIGHISSAHINRVNPGETEAMLYYGIPFRL